MSQGAKGEFGAPLDEAAKRPIGEAAQGRSPWKISLFCLLTALKGMLSQPIFIYERLLVCRITINDMQDRKNIMVENRTTDNFCIGCARQGGSEIMYR